MISLTRDSFCGAVVINGDAGPIGVEGRSFKQQSVDKDLLDKVVSFASCADSTRVVRSH